MRKIFLLAILTFSLLLKTDGVFAKGESPESIKFETGDFKSVLAKAAKENKLIFIDFYTTWCGPCKYMTDNIFPIEKVKNYYNKNFICYKIDAEKGEGPALRKKYDIRCYPTFIFTSSDGIMKHRFSSAMDADGLIGQGELAKNNKKNFSYLHKLYETGKMSSAMMPEYLKQLKLAYMDYPAVANTFFKTIEEADLLKPASIALINNYMISMDNPHFKYVVSNWDKFKDKLSEGFMDNLIFSSITNSLELKEYDRYKRYIEHLKTIDYEHRDYILAWAAKEYYCSIEDWDKFVESGCYYIDNFCSNEWVSTWRFSTEFLREEVFIGKNIELGFKYAQQAIKMMPNYSTYLSYGRLLYMTGDPKYKKQILDLYETAIAYEIENKTGRDVTPERELVERIKNMDYEFHPLSKYVITIQPIVARTDSKENPASMAIPKDLVSKAYEKAGIQFNFLEPIYWDNKDVRDGLIGLDSICVLAQKERLFKGSGDIVNMVFVDKAIGRKGPLGFGMMNGNTTFIALGDNGGDAQQRDMQAFVIAHEVGHNLGLRHIVDDIKAPQNAPNIMGDGDFCDRIDPRYSLSQYQIGEIRKSPLIRRRVEFLTNKSGPEVILDESFDTWISTMQKREIGAYIKTDVSNLTVEQAREMLKGHIGGGIMNFTDEEKKLLRTITTKTINVLNLNNLSFVAEQPWRFIKTRGDVCGGFAFTRGNCIVLNEKQLQYMAENKKKNELLMERIGKLIVHEQIHILQRTYPEKFNRLNAEYWGFIKATVTSSDDMVLNQVSNPDAISPEWLIADPQKKKEFYWARVLFNSEVESPQMGKDFVEYAYKVKASKGDYKLVIKKGKPVRVLLSELSDYQKSFAVTVGIDHPNEIAAYLFGNYFMDLFNGKEPLSEVDQKRQKTTKQFITWLTAELKK